MRAQQVTIKNLLQFFTFSFTGSNSFLDVIRLLTTTIRKENYFWYKFEVNLNAQN